MLFDRALPSLRSPPSSCLRPDGEPPRSRWRWREDPEIEPERPRRGCASSKLRRLRSRRSSRLEVSEPSSSTSRSDCRSAPSPSSSKEARRGPARALRLVREIDYIFN